MRKQPPQPPHFSRESLIADTLFRVSQIPDSALAGSSKNGVYFTIWCIPTANWASKVRINLPRAIQDLSLTFKVVQKW